jgi:hypothetical protein
MHLRDLKCMLVEQTEAIQEVARVHRDPMAKAGALPG